MVNEALIKESLVNKFGFADSVVRHARIRRIWISEAGERLFDVIEYARKDLGFGILCAISGLDEGQRLALLYHLARHDGIILSIKVTVPKDNPEIRTLTGIFPGADMYEREVADLFGFRVNGLPEGKRYPLPDDWPAGEYPLRKDWKSPQKKGEDDYAQSDNTDRPAAPGA